MDGGAGNDYLHGGTGSDVHIGGSGYDVAAYDGAAEGVAASLETGGSGGEAANLVHHSCFSRLQAV